MIFDEEIYKDFLNKDTVVAFKSLPYTILVEDPDLAAPKLFRYGKILSDGYNKIEILYAPDGLPDDTKLGHLNLYSKSYLKKEYIYHKNMLLRIGSKSYNKHYLREQKLKRILK